MAKSMLGVVLKGREGLQQMEIIVKCIPDIGNDQKDKGGRIEDEV